MTPEQQKLLSDLASAGALASVESWSKHFEEALAYVSLVAKNNPGRLDVVAARPDVKFVLEEAAAAAKADALKLAEDAWDAGVNLAKDQGGEDPPKTVLNSLKKDLDRIEADSVQHVLEAISEADAATPDSLSGVPAADKAVVKTASRSGMTTEAAAKEGFWAAWLKPLRGTKIRLVWRTTSAVPCSACTWLEGQTVRVGWQFPWKKLPLKVKPYRGELRTPPLHPHCLCFLEIEALPGD